MWLTTSQIAFWPHVPTHGLTHLLRKHALSRLQSALLEHSGRHPSYGFPWYSSMHRHSSLMHSAFGPHGLPLQKSFGIGVSSTTTFGLHCTNGSPSKPSSHVQIGTWFKTWHVASKPHDPGHGSLQRCCIHACWLGHSLLRTHSGRQLGGSPMKFSKHEQAGIPETIWHFELGPHGDGTQLGGRSVGIGSCMIAVYSEFERVKLCIILFKINMRIETARLAKKKDLRKCDECLKTL